MIRVVFAANLQRRIALPPVEVAASTVRKVIFAGGHANRDRVMPAPSGG